MILQLIKKFPKNNFVYIFNDIIKILSIIIFTHNWNISNYKSYFNYVYQLILCILIDIVNKNNSVMFLYNLISFLLLIFNFLIIFDIIYFQKNMNKIYFHLQISKKNNSLFRNFFIYLYYFFNQYFIPFFTEIIKKRFFEYYL